MPKEPKEVGLHHRLLVSRIVSLEESLEIVPLAECRIVRRICVLEASLEARHLRNGGGAGGDAGACDDIVG